MKITERYRANRPVLGALALVLAALLALPAVATAQNKDVEVKQVQLRFVDLDSGKDVATIVSGQTVQLAVGQKVRVQALAVPKKGDAYPIGARFRTVGGDYRVELSGGEQEKGWVVIEARQVLDTANNNEPTRLRVNPIAKLNGPDWLQEGIVTLDVVQKQATNDPAAVQADQLTAALYRGILLRDPDTSSTAMTQRIRQGGYPELLRVAQDIAGSSESRQVAGRQVSYQLAPGCQVSRQATTEDRLLALYENLQGKKAQEISRYEFAQNLQRLEQGGLSELVLEMVRSPAFLAEYDLGQVTRRAAIRR